MCNSFVKRAAGRARGLARAASAAAFVLLGAAFAGSAFGVNPPAAKQANNQYYDWFINTTPSYIPSPFLSDSSANSVDAFLKTLPANTPIAVKVERPISNATAKLIFNNPKYNVSYVLGDIEQTNAISKVATLVNQVRFINGVNGAKTRSYNAFVGNFGFAPVSNDFTNPANYQNQKGSHSFAGFNATDYKNAKVNMAMPELYPGSGSFRNPAAGNSSAPNIRSAMFTLPALRLSQVKINASAGTEIVPYITNFNNWAVLSLDSDRNAANGYKFIPGQAMPAKSGLPAVSANDTKNQMLSRRDFANQVAHYRLRGADTFVNFENGVLGRDNEQKRQDAKTGWTEPHINAIFQASDFKLLLGKDTDYPPPSSGDKDINSNIIIDGKEKSVESAGAMFSGVYSLTLKKLDVLLSNMDDDDHTLTLPSKIAGFDLKTKSFDVDAGQHLLIEYKLANSGPQKGWSVALVQTTFLQLSNDRNQIGVPEPTSMWFALTALTAGAVRRRRRHT